ncbi:HEAT repeat domain-containing protein [Sphingomonas sp. S1-29]|uniref:HEAT repeat domain-containing protein n=1 Tax=Sphingomonas sp. S1-29 TaxID=2991074 RepID=UPI00223EB0D9|nr:HEAT repeat domain-containing protein [Sphingomonas sp. S1-29]UZK69771.1 HEAT repeat domain-containing protein [Sphingomonas sp. S1-29]
MSLAFILSGIAAAGSLLLLAALIGVVIRRTAQEKRARLDAVRGSAFRKAVLPLLHRVDDGAVASLEAWRGDPVALEVAGHLLQILRGAERERLLDLVDALDLLQLDRQLRRLKSSGPARRIAIVRMLGSFPVPRVEQALAACLHADPAPPVRLEAGLALVRLGTLRSVDDAIVALDDGAYRAPAHRIIFRALAAQHPGEMIAAWGKHGSGPARFAIADALGEVFEPDGFAALRSAIQDADPQMRCEGLRSARRLGHPSMAPEVLAALGDPEWIVRVQAASTAGTMRLEQARPLLEALLTDEQWWVRYRASQALTALGGTRAAATAAA